MTLLQPLTKAHKIKLHEITYTQVKGKVLVQCACGTSLGKKDDWTVAKVAAFKHQVDARAGRV